MEKAKVYYTDFRAKIGEGLPTKLKRLIKAAGIGDIDMDGKFVAVKMHWQFKLSSSELCKSSS